MGQPVVMFNSQAIYSLPRQAIAAIHALKPNTARFGVLCLAAVLSFAVLATFRPSLLLVEEQVGTLGWTLFADSTPQQNLPIVVIDEKSLAEVGPWPWSRTQMASLVTAIDNAGAQLQLHDIVYPDVKVGDELLLAALQASNGAILSQLPGVQPGQATQSGTMSHPLSGIACDSLSGFSPITTSNYLAPSATFQAIPKGHIAAVISGDGAVRKTPAVVCVDGQAYPALALAAFLQATNANSWEANIRPGTGLFESAYILSFPAYPGLDIPLDSEGNLRISFASAPSAFQAFSAVDVLDGLVGPAQLGNQWVLVGATAFGMGDVVPTPYDGATPGVELHARLLTSLLDFEVPYTPNAAGWMLALLSVVFAAILYLMVSFKERLSSYGLPIVGLALPLLALALHIQLLHGSNLWLGWVYPALYSAVGAGMLMLLEHSRVRAERSRVYGNLNSYLPHDIAREIAYSVPNSDISAKRTEVTLLSADLRNFSAFGEARAPEESAAVLHFFFSRATDIIEQHGGRVHEFKGDSLLAVWDGHDQIAAAKALVAAKDMQKELSASLLSDFAPEGLEPLALGIGIEQGPALIGSIGPAHRRSHTLLGDTVTITLRIQEMTADIAEPILLGECAARQLSDQGLVSQGSYLLAGLKNPHVLFAPAPERNTDSAVTQSSPNLRVIRGGQQ
jgi:adenylate cyclase